MIGKEVRNCDYCLKGWKTYPCSSSLHDSSIKWSNESNNSSKSGNKGKGNPRMQTLLVELDSLTEIWQFLPLLESRIFFGCVLPRNIWRWFFTYVAAVATEYHWVGGRSGPLFDAFDTWQNYTQPYSKLSNITGATPIYFGFFFSEKKY